MMQNNVQTKLELFVPANPDEVHHELAAAASRKFQKVVAEDFTRVVTFRSGASLLTWGENFHAQTVPAEGGSTVRIVAVGRNGGSYQHNTRAQKLMTELMAAVTDSLRERARH